MDLPAGKVQLGETDAHAMIREIKEETGYNAKEEELHFLWLFSWKFSEYQLDFPTFQLKLKKSTLIKHNPYEHVEHKLVTAEECDAMTNLVPEFHDLLRKVSLVTQKANIDSTKKTRKI